MDAATTASASPPPLQRCADREATGTQPFTSAAGGAFATPDDVAPLAAANARTPLHYEILEFMRHSTPSEATLRDVEHVLNAVRFRLRMHACMHAYPPPQSGWAHSSPGELTITPYRPI